jgi:hypothetical protein
MQIDSSGYLESLRKSIRNMKIADHMLYVTYPVIKDKKLLLKALDQIHESIICLINAVLEYDYLFKRIKLYKDSGENLRTFLEKCARRYNISSEECHEITNFLSLVSNYRKSSMEFQRKEKVIIMSDALKITSIDSEKLKKYLSLAKNLIAKASPILNQ